MYPFINTIVEDLKRDLLNNLTKSSQVNKPSKSLNTEVGNRLIKLRENVHAKHGLLNNTRYALL